jgi:hypothetical protein
VGKIFSWCSCQSIISAVNVLNLKFDVFVVDVLKVDVLEVVQMGRPKKFNRGEGTLKTPSPASKP